MRNHTAVMSIFTICIGATLPPAAALDESPLERLDRQMSKRVTLELVDTPLTDACQLLSSITGMTIVIAPAVRTAKPVVSLNVKDMDAGTCLGWLARLTETFAEVDDGAIFVTDKRSAKLADKERSDLMLLGAESGVAVELPPDGQELSDDDRRKVALQILEKEQIKVQDFPGPSFGIEDISPKK